jgi:hypothetical protein
VRGRQLSLSLAQMRVEKALAPLLAVGIDTSERAVFSWSAGGGEVEIDITEADFMSPDAPAGAYVCRLLDEAGNVKEEIAAVKIEIRHDSMPEPPNARAALDRSVSTMLDNARCELERIARRLTESEDIIDKMRRERRVLEDHIREREALISELERALEAADDGSDLAGLADVLGELAIRVLGLDEEQVTDETVSAVETVLEVIRRSQNAQRALSENGAGPALRLLGIGGEEGQAPCL